LRSFRTECGIRQGDSLSTLLFNTGLEKVVRNIEINPCDTIFNRTRQFIVYADEAAVTGRTGGVLNETQINTENPNYIKTKESINAANTDT
jgi:hypothetical protein